MAESKNRPDIAGRLKPAPQGMILVVTIVALLLIALMGAAIILNTSVEMNTASNTVSGREAFSRADSAIQVTTHLTDIMQNPDLGEVTDALNNSASLYTVAINKNTFNYTDLITDMNRSSVNQRYLRAGRAAPGSGGEAPDLIFREAANNAVVATAMVSRDFDFLEGGDDLSWAAGHTTGATSGIVDTPGSGDGTIKTENYLVTATGRTPSSRSGDFFGSDEAGATEPVFGPNSVITAILRLVIL